MTNGLQEQRPPLTPHSDIIYTIHYRWGSRVILSRISWERGLVSAVRRQTSRRQDMTRHQVLVIVVSVICKWWVCLLVLIGGICSLWDRERWKTDCWRTGNQREHVPLDGAFVLLQPFLLWRDVDQWSLCFNSGALC